MLRLTEADRAGARGWSTESVVWADTPPRVLVVSSESHRVRGTQLRAAVEAEGYAVDMAWSAVEGLERFAAEPPALVLLHSLQRPSSWIDVCRQMRKVADVPVVIGFPLPSQVDVVIAFELGVVGYVNDPTRTQELLARVRAALRSSGPNGSDPRVRRTGAHDVCRAGHVIVDVDAREVTVRGTPVHLSRLEFDLLALLLDPPSQVHTRQEIMRTVWASRPDTASRSLDTHVRWLRQKLEDDPTNPRYLVTVWGVGFRFDAEMEPRPA